MKIFDVATTVFFIRNNEVIEALIDRNNWVNSGTYSVVFNKDNYKHREIVSHHNIYKTIDEANSILEETLIREEEQRVEKNLEEQREKRENAIYYKQDRLDSIECQKRYIENSERDIKRYRENITRYEAEIVEFDKIINLKLSDGSTD